MDFNDTDINWKEPNNTQDKTIYSYPFGNNISEFTFIYIILYFVFKFIRFIHFSLPLTFLIESLYNNNIVMGSRDNVKQYMG